MNKKSLLAMTLTTLALIPLSCTVETSKSEGTGGTESGGATHAAGASSIGGANATGGVATNGGTTAAATGVAGNVGVAGSTAATGGSSPTAGAGGATVVATAGAAGAVQSTATGGAATTTTTVAQTRVDVTSAIQAATTWTADHVYVIPAGSTLYVSATLTIQAGTVIKFGSGARLYIETEGQLNAIGTATAPIVFTALKDDTAGGDTNGDGSASQASIGDWSEVTVDGNSSSFDYVQLRYSNTGIQLGGGSQSVKHSVFTSNKTALDVTGVTSAANTLITDNVFYGNEHPLYTDASVAINATNVFHNPNLATQGNTFQAIEVKGSVESSVTWSNIEVAYALYGTGASYYVESPAALTLASGVVLKFGISSALIVSTGATLNGATTASFTSYRDDTLLGDSNGDGAATAPAAGDWDGVRVITSTTDDWLSGTNIKYATN